MMNPPKHDCSSPLVTCRQTSHADHGPRTTTDDDHVNMIGSSMKMNTVEALYRVPSKLLTSFHLIQKHRIYTLGKNSWPFIKDSRLLTLFYLTQQHLNLLVENGKLIIIIIASGASDCFKL